MLHNSPDKDTWRGDLNKKIDAVRRLAREFADVYVPLDGLFAAASVQKEPSYWAADGAPDGGRRSLLRRLRRRWKTGVVIR